MFIKLKKNGREKKKKMIKNIYIYIYIYKINNDKCIYIYIFFFVKKLSKKSLKENHRTKEIKYKTL
jgi:hypothetical protein